MNCDNCGKEWPGITQGKNGTNFCNNYCEKAYNINKALQPEEKRKEIIKPVIDMRPELFGLRYKDCTFDNYICKRIEQGKVRKKIIEIAKVMKEKKKADQLIAFIGGVGTGKDHLAAALVHYIGYIDVIHTTVMKISREVRESKSQQKIIDNYTNQDLLIINEIGIQSVTDFERNILHEIIDSIYRNMRNCILISNEFEDKFKTCIDYPKQSRVWDRIGEKIIFDWDSYRQRHKGLKE